MKDKRTITVVECLKKNKFSFKNNYKFLFSRKKKEKYEL